MLSVTEAAKELNVSASRVRKMIYDGVIQAEKVGNSWVISESVVAERLLNSHKAGRPKANLDLQTSKSECINLHDVYVELRDGNFARPSASTISVMKDKDEVGFLLSVCDYFLNLKQREEIEMGVY